MPDAKSGTNTDGGSNGSDNDNTGGNEECVDSGFFDGSNMWTCRQMKRYFKQEHNARPNDWCRDTVNNWASYCCQMCSGNIIILHWLPVKTGNSRLR